MIARPKIVSLCLLAAGLVAAGTAGACGISWSEPKSHFDGVDYQGHVHLIETLGQLDVGKGLKLPLFAVFNSSYSDKGPYLGAGWELPLLESRIVQVDENTFMLKQPDGWFRNFWRNKSDPSLLDGSGGWKAQIQGNTITAWADCGWKLVFVDGKIRSMSTPQGRQFDWIQNGGRVAEIREGGTPRLLVRWDEKLGLINELEFNGQKVGLEYGDKPRVQNIPGKNVVAAMDRSLAAVEMPGGEKKFYQYGVDDKLDPTMTIGERKIAWDPVAKTALRDEGWNYDVKPGAKPGDYAAIGRTDQKGQKEYWFKDALKGEELSTSADGVTRKTSWFTSGVLVGKKRSVVDLINGKESRAQKWSYDERGRVLRFEDIKGSAVAQMVYHYYPNQMVVERFRGTILQEVNLFDQRGLLKRGYYNGGKIINYALINGVIIRVSVEKSTQQLSDIIPDINANLTRVKSEPARGENAEAL